MSDAEKESIQLSGEIIRLLNGRTETACLDALMRTAASVICDAHASLGDARLKAFDVGKVLELVACN